MTKEYERLHRLLLEYKHRIDDLIKANISSLGNVSCLQEACAYALNSPGKRFRPAIVMMVAEEAAARSGLDNPLDVDSAALAVEYFHTASLIADDLPCMDDDDMRRDQPSTHKKFGEGMAILATYALIADGYRKIYECGEKMVDSPFSKEAYSRLSLSLKSASENTGIDGATGGQFLDLYPPRITPEILIKVIEKKTVTLFDLAFTLGWLFGGGPLGDLKDIREIAYHFGMAFQMIDDLQDLIQDKEQKSEVNLFRALGKDKAMQLLEQELKKLAKSFQKLDINEGALFILAESLREETERLLPLANF